MVGVVTIRDAFGTAFAAQVAEDTKRLGDSSLSWVVKEDEPELVSQCVCIARYLGLMSEYIGSEIWYHDATTLPEGLATHIDRDEGIQNRLVLPECGIVYYPEVVTSSGGALVLSETETIYPKTDTLVLFPKGIPHRVEAFIGDRLSIPINPWKKKPTIY